MPHSQFSQGNLSLRYFRPPVELERYFQTIFLLETDVCEGEVIKDFVLPSWGIVNWRDRPTLTLEFRDGHASNTGLNGAVGPFDHAVSLECGRLRQWSAVLLPAGWSRYVDAPARLYANRAVEIDNDPAFAAFDPISDRLFEGPADPEAELDLAGLLRPAHRLLGHGVVRCEHPATGLTRRASGPRNGRQARAGGEG